MLKKNLLVALIFLATISYGSIRVHAADEEGPIIGAIKGAADRVCQPTKVIFENIAKDQPQQSIVRFGYNYDSVRFLKLFYNIFGVSIDSVMKCLPVVGPGFSGMCSFLGEPQINCDNFLHGLGYATDQQRQDFANSPISGSLLGMYYYMQDTNTNTTTPLNLAYFWNRQTENIPMVGRSLAADSAYNSPYLAATYGAWQAIRNLSFAFLAIIMLIIGIMIITRRKIDAKTSVTVQQALPRVIIAVILTAFSYPIGATIANVSFWLSLEMPLYIARTIGGQAFTMFASTTPGQINMGSVIVFIMGGFVSIGLAPVVILAGIVTVILIIIVSIIIALKFFLTYIKMIFAVITAPAVLVLSAVPGNEKRVEDWFKQLLVYALSMIALMSMTMLSFMVGLNVVLTGNANDIKSGFIPSGASLWSGLLILMLFLIFGLIITLQMPGKIEAALMDTKKKR